MKRVLLLWLIMFSIAAYAWLSLAGVVLVLMIAFTADASPSWDEHLRAMMAVAGVLILLPLLCAALVTLILAFVVVAFEVLWRRFWKRSPDAPQMPAPPTPPLTPAPLRPPQMPPPPPRGPRPPWLRLAVCLLWAGLGSAVIIDQLQRTASSCELVPLIMTTFIFFLPLVWLPLLLVGRMWRTYRSQRASGPGGDAR